LETFFIDTAVALSKETAQATLDMELVAALFLTDAITKKPKSHPDLQRRWWLSDIELIVLCQKIAYKNKLLIHSIKLSLSLEILTIENQLNTTNPIASSQ
jgi:hypothetical protein